MASIDLAHLSQLANLPLSETEAGKFQIEETYQSLASISKLDLSAIPETARVIEEENILREDEVRPSFSQAEATQNASQTHDGFFVVKSIFENRES